MKIILDRSAQDLGIAETVVYYSWSKYVPQNGGLVDFFEILPNHTSKHFQHRGSSELIGDNDFAEYGLLYRPDKEKFNTNLPINMLSDRVISIIGSDKEELGKISEILMPYVTESDDNKNLRFFGSTSIQGQTIHLLNVPKGCWKIEVYSEHITSNSPSYSDFVDSEILNEVVGSELGRKYPNITIYLGPSADLRINPDSFYYDFDRRKESRDVDINPIEYTKLVEEIYMWKNLWLTQSVSTKTVDVNLSFKSWLDDYENPNRNLGNWILRNDELYSSLESIHSTEGIKGTEYCFDKRSGNLLGSVLVENTPILNKKLGELREDWTPTKRYQTLEEVDFSDDRWVSSAPNNYKQSPILSPKWSRVESVDSTYKRRYLTLIDPPMSGKSLPGGYISEASDEILVVDNNGYRFKKCTNTKQDLVPNVDFKILSNVVPGENDIHILNWSKIQETEKLMFVFEPIPNEIYFNAIFSGITKKYEVIDGEISWESYFREGSFRLCSINSEEVLGPPFNVVMGDKIALEFTKPFRHEVQRVFSEYVTDGGYSNRDIEFVVGDDRIVIFDEVDYISSTYNLVLLERFINIGIENINNFSLSSTSQTSINVGGDFEISFYSDDTIFNQLEILSDKDSALIILTIEENLVELGNTSFSLSEVGGIYTVRIKNVLKDYKLKIL